LASVSADAAKLLQTTLLRWQRDPAAYAREALGFVMLPHQVKAAYAVRDNDRVCIRSGHGTGKTSWLAAMVDWWINTRTPALVACTAPTQSQLSDGLWRQASIMQMAKPEGFRAQTEILSDKIRLREAPEINYATARVARKESPVAFQGFHDKNMLLVADEASGVDDKIFEVGEGALTTPGAKLILTGNPTQASGYFYTAFRDPEFVKFHWNTEELAKANPGGYISLKFAERVAAKWGRDSDVYRIRVLGDFPLSDGDAIIPRAWIEAAQGRLVMPIEVRPVWGLDVAYYGDDKNALVKRLGNVLLEPPKWWAKADTMQTAGRVVREFADAREKGEDPEYIYIDKIGYGAGVYDRLREQGLPVVGINVSESPAIKEKYTNLRAELWFRAREWFEDLSCRLPDAAETENGVARETMQDFIDELSGVKFKIRESNGKLQAESKDDMKKRGLMSPNLADAFILTFSGSDVRTELTLATSDRKRYGKRADQFAGSTWMAA
jgi:phage terminase large subunit